MSNLFNRLEDAYWAAAPYSSPWDEREQAEEFIHEIVSDFSPADIIELKKAWQVRSALPRPNDENENAVNALLSTLAHL
jgi:hypothetical protein